MTKTASKSFVYFLLVFDETMDIFDTSQLAVFTKGVKVMEKFLDVVSLKGSITGKDIKADIIKCVKNYKFVKKILMAMQQMEPIDDSKKLGGSIFDSET